MSENKIISIPLRQGSNSKSINMAAVTAAVSQEYAVRYLESLGASPTRDKIELVNAQMNIKVNSRHYTHVIMPSHACAPACMMHDAGRLGVAKLDIGKR